MSTLPFSEMETRQLIKLRQDMHPLFAEKTRKRGIQQLYAQLAERLYETGGGEWPLRPQQAVAQKWNNVVGSYKVSAYPAIHDAAAATTGFDVLVWVTNPPG